MNTKSRLSIAAAIAIIIAAIVALLLQRDQHTDAHATATAIGPEVQSMAPNTPPSAPAPTTRTSQNQTSTSTSHLGQQPIRLADLHGTEDPEEVRFLENQRQALEDGFGSTPALSTTEQQHPQAASVIEAYRTGQHPSRLSAMVPPKPFDPARYRNDPTYRANYLATAEPGRIHQSNQHANTQLERLTPFVADVEQGESITLSLRGTPNMPISITSMDLGRFGNGLTFETKEADNNGVASFQFHGVVGTIADSNLIAASPVCRGQIKFVIHTVLPGINDLQPDDVIVLED